MPDLFGSIIAGAAQGYGAQVAAEGKAAREAALRKIEVQDDRAYQDARDEKAYQREAPLKNLQLQEAQLKIDALKNPNANLPDAVRSLDWRAKQAGLEPGTPEYQKFIATNGTANANGAAKYGLNPVYMKDKNGNIVAGQLSSDNQLTPAQTQDGLTILSPYDKSYQTSQGNAEGKAVANARVTLPAVIAMADNSVKTINDLENHPGKSTATGLSGTFDPRNYIAGTDAANFHALRKQVNGQTFLSAYQTLKGAGAITDIEGQKAEQAIANLDTSQSEEQFSKALQDLKTVIESGKERAIQLASGNLQPMASSQQQSPSPTTNAPLAPHVEDLVKKYGGK